MNKMGFGVLGFGVWPLLEKNANLTLAVGYRLIQELCRDRCKGDNSESWNDKN